MANVFAYIETFTTQCARIPLMTGVLRMRFARALSEHPAA